MAHPKPRSEDSVHDHIGPPLAGYQTRGRARTSTGTFSRRADLEVRPGLGLEPPETPIEHRDRPTRPRVQMACDHEAVAAVVARSANDRRPLSSPGTACGESPRPPPVRPAPSGSSAGNSQGIDRGVSSSRISSAVVEWLRFHQRRSGRERSRPRRHSLEWVIDRSMSPATPARRKPGGPVSVHRASASPRSRCPPHELDSEAERLSDRFLAGEAGSEMLRGFGPRETVAPLRLGEHAVDEARVTTNACGRVRFRSGRSQSAPVHTMLLGMTRSIPVTEDARLVAEYVVPDDDARVAP